MKRFYIIIMIVLSLLTACTPSADEHKTGAIFREDQTMARTTEQTTKEVDEIELETEVQELEIKADSSLTKMSEYLEQSPFKDEFIGLKYDESKVIWDCEDIEISVSSEPVYTKEQLAQIAIDNEFIYDGDESFDILDWAPVELGIEVWFFFDYEYVDSFIIKDDGEVMLMANPVTRDIYEEEIMHNIQSAKEYAEEPTATLSVEQLNEIYPILPWTKEMSIPNVVQLYKNRDGQCFVFFCFQKELGVNELGITTLEADATNSFGRYEELNWETRTPDYLYLIHDLTNNAIFTIFADRNFKDVSSEHVVMEHKLGDFGKLMRKGGIDKLDSSTYRRRFGILK